MINHNGIENMISLFYILISSFILFIIGFIALILNKNILFMLISLEIMINSIALFLISISKYYNQIDGQIFYILLITLSAIESSISLTLLIQIYRKKYTLNIKKISEIYE